MKYIAAAKIYIFQDMYEEVGTRSYRYYPWFLLSILSLNVEFIQPFKSVPRSIDTITKCTDYY